MNSFPSVSDQEDKKAKAWMDTRSYRRRFDRLRKRAAGGELMTMEQIAKYLDIPLGRVAASALKHWNKPGGFIPAINDTGGAAN